MRLLKLYWVLVVAGLGWGGPLWGQQGLLLWGAEPIGPVYVRSDADERELAAANLLVEYLNKVSGLEWELKTEDGRLPGRGIFVGRTRQAAIHRLWMEPGRDLGIRQVVLNRSLFLLGNAPEATYWAVSDFLQNRVGVRWFIPGGIGVEYEPLDRLRIPVLNRTYYPVFQERMLLAVRNTDWGRFHYLYETFHFNHNLHRIITADLIEEHPDLFSVVAGERVPVTGGRSAQPNLAHPDLHDWVAEHIRSAFTENPELPAYSIATTDSTLFDESSLTEAWIQPMRYFRGRPDYSNLVFHFSNEIARRVASTHPDRYVTQLAYFWTENVPEFPVHSQVIPYLTFDRAQWFDPEQREDDQSLVKAWAEAGPEFLGTWDYYFGSPFFIPRVYTAATAESLKFLSEHGVRNFFAQGRPLWGFDGPRFWLASQLLWDPDQNQVALLNEFYSRFYGPAAEPMRAFFEGAEYQWMSQRTPGYWIKYFQDPAQAELFPPEVCATLMEYLEESRAVVAGQSPYEERVALTYEAFRFTWAASEYYHHWWAAAREASPTDEQVQAYQSWISEVRSAWAGQEHPGSLNVLELLLMDDPSARGSEAPETGALLKERFQDMCLPEELWGLNILGPWRSRIFNTEDLTVLAADDGLRVEGSNFFSLYQWIAADGAGSLWVQAPVCGYVSSGSQVYLQVSFMDKEGNVLTETWRDRLPTGDYSETIPLTLVGKPPDGTVWIYVGLKVLYQFPGDWVEWQSVEVR